MKDPGKVDILGRVALIVMICSSAALISHQVLRPYLETRRNSGYYREAVEILSLADGGIDRLDMEIRVIEEGIGELETLLPRDINVDAFLEELSDLAEATGVHIERLTPSQVTEYDFFRELVLDVYVTGTFPAVHEFIVSLERGKQLSRINQITIADDGSRNRCTVRMGLALYFALKGRA
jgi:Tfp pilus assembly protein PilO